MNIKCSYALLHEGKVWSFYNHTFEEEDLIEILKEKFKNGDLSCPINLNRENCKIDYFSIDEIKT